MNPLLLTDFYKVHHHRMYPEGTSMIYSNLTPRKSRLPGVNKIVFFGLQHFILDYLITGFNEHFFERDWEEVRKEYIKHIDVDTAHIEELHQLGYLPIEIKALEEGTLCPIGVPCLTIMNTNPEFYWLTNYLETLLSAMLWQPITSATIAYEYKKLLTYHAVRTTGSSAFVQWQGHDFSMRGMSSIESAILSGMGHLTCFTGTDTIPSIYTMARSYGADGLIGASVPATEHSVMCAGTKEEEIETFKRLLKLYPTGILSVVSDTWDLWHVITVILPQIKDKILARDGKLVIRPDSGDPVDIICGTNSNPANKYREETTPQAKGVVELLWDIFGGETNKYGYKQLDSHIGTIYGDSITLDRARSICERLAAKGFASTNVVFGIGSYTYQHNTRDTTGQAIKATYAERIEHKISQSGENWVERTVGYDLWKDPITDDGTKKSAKGLLQVVKDQGGNLKLNQGVSREEENTGELKSVFRDGILLRKTTLDSIRAKLNEINF